MAVPYTCKNEARRRAVRAHATLNGIDYLEALDQDAIPLLSPRQRTLLVHCFKPLPALTGANVFIEGGVRITPVHVQWAFPSNAVPAAVASIAERNFFSALANAASILVVRTDSGGDFSEYRLSLVQSPVNLNPPANFDSQLSSVDFSFKVECPTDFDCAQSTACTTQIPPAPVLDYLAKDYASFRRLMFDRLSNTLPSWTERNPADIGVALVETLAYAADQLSYRQDAVATEAFLETARKRVSVKRHARLLDYPMGEGSNARVWVAIQPSAGSSADGATVPAGATLLTKTQEPRGRILPEKLGIALNQGALVFQTMRDLTIKAAHNEIALYTWGDEDCCLPKGATRATLRNDGAVLALAPGDVLIFEEVRGAKSGLEVDADLTHRHAVRLAAVTPAIDPLIEESPGQPLRLLDIAWHAEDALPFPLCLSVVNLHPVSVARGNVVLADHGRKISGELLPEIRLGERYRPRLKFSPITQAAPFDRSASATSTLLFDPKGAGPQVQLIENGRADQTWNPRPDLLSSDRFERGFVVEVEEDQRAFLRFGDDTLGRRPSPGSQFSATYRIGGGPSGNVGAEAIAHIVTDQAGVADVRNPLPARGGTDPESMEKVRLYAPQAFRRQERAVTEADYAEVAERHPDVYRAAATLRWTGSWYTMFVTIDRRGGRTVDAKFEAEMTEFLERYRLAGYDVEVDGPTFVPLDILLGICVEPGYTRSAVRSALLEVFSIADLPDGRRGFFHPDNFTFGQPVYLSQVVSAAMRVPGVRWVDADDVAPNRFQRLDDGGRSVPADGALRFHPLEIARLDNDPSRQENGRIDFVMEGGL